MTLTFRRVIKQRKELIASFFGCIGFLWLIIEITDYFFNYKDKISSRYFCVIILIGFVYALKANRPKSYFEYKLRDKDVYIGVRIGNLIDTKGAIVVPINNKFNINQNGVTNAKSILNTIITEIYNGNKEHLDGDIKNKIDIAITHDIGTTIEIVNKNRKLYFVANSHLNKNQRSESTINDFYDTLNQFFYHISTDSDREEELAVPLFNSGHGRIPNLTRDTIVKEMIYLFIEAVKTKVVCDKLVIYIYPDDIKKGQIDIDEIEKYLAYNANNYRDIVVNNATPEGHIVEGSQIPSEIQSIKN